MTGYTYRDYTDRNFRYIRSNDNSCEAAMVYNNASPDRSSSRQPNFYRRVAETEFLALQYMNRTRPRSVRTTEQEEHILQAFGNDPGFIICQLVLLCLTSHSVAWNDVVNSLTTHQGIHFSDSLFHKITVRCLMLQSSLLMMQ